VTISDYDRANVGAILSGSGSWFTAELLRLMAHADSLNFAKLAIAFPDVAQAYTDWYEGDGDL